MNQWLFGLTGLTLQHPSFLWLLLLLPSVFWRRHRPAILLSTLPVVDTLPRSRRLSWLWIPTVARVVALCLLIFALARPIERIAVPVPSKGIDILLVLDVSSSMRANDLDPERTRLDVTKGAAKAFVAARPEDRIGLVTFARYPDLRCPKTLDHQALQDLLSQVELVVSDGPEDATGIGTAVAASASLLQDSQASSKVVVLLTDGEENVATPLLPSEIAPRHAAQLAERLGVRVYAIAAGIGNRQADGSVKALDTAEVERLAARTGGRFFKAEDASALTAVYQAIDRLERSVQAEPRFLVEEWCTPFLAMALVLLLVARLLSASVLEVGP